MRAELSDVLVVGAGPAGLSAAVAAADAGARVTVVDSGQQIGGQFWRHAVEQNSESQEQPDGRGHHNWGHFLNLRSRFNQHRAQKRIRFLPGQQVWMVERGPDQLFIAHCTPTQWQGQHGGTVLSAERLVLCTGGYDRQLPIPGWDLPGVMAAGGVQGYIKANGVLPGRQFVIAGTGPFLLSVAANIAAAGGKVKAVLEAKAVTDWLPHLVAASGVPGKALEGVEYASTFLRHRIPYKTRSVITNISNDVEAKTITWAKVDRAGALVPDSGGTYENIDIVGLGWGFTPLLELAVSLGVETRVDVDGSLVGIVDDRQESSVPGLYLAGEITGVGGATLAQVEGHAAGSAAGGGPGLSWGAKAQRRRHRRFARAMHTVHPIPERWQDWVRPDTLLCRCEEVTFAQAQEAREELGATDSRSLKSFARVGMGWCQGKVCGLAASCLSAGIGQDPDSESLSSVLKRPLAVPVPLTELAMLAPGEELTGLGSDSNDTTFEHLNSRLDASQE